MPVGFQVPTSDVESVVGIQFGIFSPEEIMKRSVVEITTQSTYDGAEPRIGGLFDPRMGVLDNGKTCRSCGQTNHNCPGHFGHYRLARPVYFIQFFGTVLNVLRCVCVKCSKLLIDKEKHANIAKRRGEARWREVLKLCDNIRRCGQETEDGCGTIQPSRYVRDKITSIIAEWDDLEPEDEGDDKGKKTKKKTRQPLEVEYVLRLFRQILDEDVDFMGLSRHWCRPDWMICTVLPIPPPQVRPSVVQDNNQRSEDDLTHKLSDIIKWNRKLQDAIDRNLSSKTIDEHTQIVQYHVATLVDNKIPGVAPSAQRGGRPLKSIQQRIGSKEGRVRYNIQGKRVEQSARSVITGDPNISIAEVGVPLKIAMNLTKPERVTEFNRALLYKYVQNGADKHPGAKSIVLAKSGRMISLKHVNTNEIVLHLGDVVHRHLIDGDIILFNRQPTLHRMSMMGHRVRVLDYNTFRLNVTVTRPYNADFDGDEMNAHIPQSYEATAELQEIAAVPKQIIRPRDGTPLISVVQDALAGAYLATQPNNLFTRREYMNLMMKNKRFEELPLPRSGARYTGQQIVGSLLAPVNIDMENSSYEQDSSDYNKIKIVEGDFLQGVLDKGIFNKTGKGIVHTTYNDYGPEDTVALLDGLQNVMESYLIMKGFSVGVSDLIADEETRKQMDEVIQEKKKEFDQVLLQLHMDLFVNNSGKSNQEELEARAFGILNKAIASAGEAGLTSLSKENRLMAMIRSGSKGDGNNVSQMIACLGQVAVEGKRIPYGFTDRTLPHYKMYDDSAEARGFVESSFLRGLTPQEMFFHAMAGREGLIDTAVKTAETGYTQRQLIKAMEDLTTQHDGSVRDATGAILQFHYGEDGTNSTKIEEVSLNYGTGTRDSLLQTFSMTSVDLTGILQEGVERGDDREALQQYAQQIVQDRVMIQEKVKQFSLHKLPLFAPINLERVIQNIAIKFQLDKTKPTNLTPSVVLEDIERMIQRTQPYHKVWTACVRFHLAPHKMILERRFTREAWSTLVETIVIKNWKSWAVPGELVGIVAAQSIGEPATQMTLNSVDWDTQIVIAKNGKIVTPQIGEFIDDYIMNCPESIEIQKLPNDQLYIPLDDGNDWKAISCDEDGNMVWTKLEAITRHPVINEDGTNTIVEVELESGRSVKATKGKSFLTLQNGKILGTNGSDLKVGDALPIQNKYALEQLGLVESINLRTLLPPTEYLYGSEVGKAQEALMSGDRHWFQKNQGTLFTVPYSRSDSFRDAFLNGKNSNDIREGHIYNKHMKLNASQIPETIPLTEEFGFFAGAYVAEGMSNDTQICITNNDPTYLNKVKTFVEAWNIGTHVVCEERHCKKTNIKGTTTSLIIHSTILAKVMKAYFGRVSYEKTLPDWTLQAPESFVRGLVDGYMSGDGTVEKRSGILHASSVSKDLLVRLSAVFARFGIFTTMSSHLPDQKAFASVSTVYTLTIPRTYAAVFASHFHLTVQEKQERLDTHFREYTDKRSKWSTTKDVVWDKIKSIKEVTPIKGWVYDVTVEGTRNFCTLDRIGQKDTFHQAGVAAKSAMTRGVPRLKELLKATQNPKATSLTVTLKPAFRSNKDRVREVSQDLELTLLKDIVLKAAIYYDPSDDNTIIKEDRELIAFYKQFEVRQETEESEEQGFSRWLLRLELDREKMFNKNITMDDIHFVLHDLYFASDASLSTIYSDYNSQKLVMRIRFSTEKTMFLDDLAGMKKFQTKLLGQTVIRGVPGIRSVTWRKDKNRVELTPDGKYEAVEQYILDTDGANFLEVLNHPAVDGTMLYSTNIHDIYEQLGVEATRAVLYSEINTLFENGSINYRHLGLLCDVMTRNGRLMTIDRYGINKNDSGPLAKACFEETEKILLKAALFGEMDAVTGVSANIMMGQAIRAGTAFTQVLLDETAYARLMEKLPPVEPEEDEDEIELSQSNVDAQMFRDTNDMCNQVQIQMNLKLSGKVPTIENEEELEIQVI